jgi:hypothetical protein
MDMTTALTIKAQVVGQGQINGLTGGLKKVEGQSRKTATAMGRLKGAAAGAMGALRTMLPLLSVAALGSFAKGSIDAADSMSKLSQRTGIAAPELDKFRKVAERSDTSIESLERAFPALTKNMKTAADTGKGPVLAAFQQLGIAIKDSQGNLRATDAVMLDLADRFQNMADGSEKAALASTIFGTRIGSELIPMLNSGGDAVRNMSTSMTQEFADGAAAFNDKIEDMQEDLGDLGIKLIKTLLPTLEKIVDIVATLVDAFMALPEPVQNAIIAFGAFKLVAPLFAGLVPAITGIVGALGSIVTALTGGGGVMAAIAAVFTGPVGWIALAVAAGVAIYKFRDQIADAAQAIFNFLSEAFKKVFDVVSGVIQNLFNFWKNTFFDPLFNTGKKIYAFFADTFKKVGEAISAPIKAAMEFVKGIVNGVLRGIGSVINGFINNINNLIGAANRVSGAVGGPQLGYIPNVTMPQFAQGGVVNGPTVAMVGEGGEPEYIIPQSKMARASANYLGGLRGRAVIPAFADGGVVGPGSTCGGGGAANTTVQVTTGPVLQHEGRNYVTVDDLERALKVLADAVFRNSRTYGGRRLQGLA